MNEKRFKCIKGIKNLINAISKSFNTFLCHKMYKAAVKKLIYSSPLTIRELELKIFCALVTTLKRSEKSFENQNEKEKKLGRAFMSI